MKRYFVVLINLLILGFVAMAQQEQYTTVELSQLGLFANRQSSGNVLITQDTRLNDIVKSYINYHANSPLKGWRVQVYFGTGHNARQSAERVRAQFMAQYPGIPVYIIYQQPYFKVRVGNFVDRIAASKFLFLIKEDYPKAFLTEDKIDLDKLTQ